MSEALAAYADRPLFLLGHGTRALVAFETARVLEQRGSVARLFVSAARSPSRRWEEHVDVLGDDAVVELRRLGGVPEPVLRRDPGAVREVLRLLRSGHRALRRYRCQEGVRLAAPVTVLAAETDPRNSLEQTG